VTAEGVVPQTQLTTGGGVSADDAWRVLRDHGRMRLLRDCVRRFRGADGATHARAIAFQVSVAVFPFAVAILGLAATLRAGTLNDVVRHTLSKVTPGSSKTLLSAASRSHAGTSGELALWAGVASGVIAITIAMAEIERASNRLYGIGQDRPTARKYGRALVLALTAGVFSMIGFLVMVAGSAIGQSLAAAYHWSPDARTAWAVTRWPVGIALSWISVTVIFGRTPRRRQPDKSWLAIGALLSLVLWLAFTGLLALYVANSSTFGSTYGPLTGVIALLLWANLSAFALLLGVAFNAQLESVRATAASHRVHAPSARRVATR
jgi:YihY family inner membrane protein